MNDGKIFTGEFIEEQLSTKKRSVFDPVHRRKRIILWFIRTTFIVCFYVLLWNVEWVRWTLLLTVPLSLISFVLWVFGPAIMRRRMIAYASKELPSHEKQQEIIS